MDEFLDFEKICRVCLNAGVMMSIFKVNISKKLMSCASIQVWQNDGLPTQICNKCSAKLHISIQFKKLCEKSDSRLRQYYKKISERPAEPPPQQQQQQQQQPPIEQAAPPVQINETQKTQIEITQYNQAIPENNCVYIECNPLIENIQQENNFMQIAQADQQQIEQIEYPQLGTFNVEGVGQVQVYNGTYNIPLPHPGGLEMAPVQIQTQTHFVEQPQQPPISNDTAVKKEEEKESKPDSTKQCPTCNKIFGNSTKLSRHMKTHASDLPYKCKVCNKGFAHSGNFKIHLRTHTGERPFKCIICNRGCRQAQDLEKHMRTHTGEKPHKCLMCPKGFSTRSNLIAHIRTHTGERPYVCCVCQKSFCQSNELTKHMRTHTGEKSHVCEICQKGFNGSSTLIVHMRSHTGERPYLCPICNKGFTQNSCLQAHIRRHVNKNAKTSQEQTQEAKENFSCNFCNSSFETSTQYTDHLKTHSTVDDS